MNENSPSLLSHHSSVRPPWLAIDVGNSRIKYGWFVEQSRGDGRAWPHCQHFTAGPLSCPAPWDRIRAWTNPLACEVAIAGSNPAVVEQLATHWQATTGRLPWVVHDRRDLPITVDVRVPERVGLDRLLNAVAANILRANDRPAIVVDSGTATTVDVVTAAGAFVGGAILPGFALAAKALHDYTALLPELSVQELGPEVPTSIGRDTHAALRSGIYWGQVGAIRELVRRHEQAAPSTGVAHHLLLTGGGAPWLESQFPEAQHIPSLAMHGLVLTAWSRR